jgi:hypothetical protein
LKRTSFASIFRASFLIFGFGFAFEIAGLGRRKKKKKTEKESKKKKKKSKAPPGVFQPQHPPSSPNQQRMFSIPYFYPIIIFMANIFKRELQIKFIIFSHL